MLGQCLIFLKRWYLGAYMKQNQFCLLIQVAQGVPHASKKKILTKTIFIIYLYNNFLFKIKCSSFYEMYKWVGRWVVFQRIQGPTYHKIQKQFPNICILFTMVEKKWVGRWRMCLIVILRSVSKFRNTWNFLSFRY